MWHGGYQPNRKASDLALGAGANVVVWTLVGAMLQNGMLYNFTLFVQNFEHPTPRFGRLCLPPGIASFEREFLTSGKQFFQCPMPWRGDH